MSTGHDYMIHLSPVVRLLLTQSPQDTLLNINRNVDFWAGREDRSDISNDQ